ncbi:MAG TPA: hypothetical protein VGS16_04940 [Candidatus Dormibacteraeota bacterium]|nr:hypothetical protein [Candidatus Dormibacteraeota bacterium]
MSITFLRDAVEQRSRPATGAVVLEIARSADPVVWGMSGALAGAATGIAVGGVGALMAPGLSLPVFIAMGLLFGAFNGGLLGLITHPENRY